MTEALMELSTTHSVITPLLTRSLLQERARIRTEGPGYFLSFITPQVISACPKMYVTITVKPLYAQLQSG